MPTISPGKTSKPLDPNALSLDRIRRNFQTLSQGVNNLLHLSPTGGLSDGSTGLEVNVDGTTITIVNNTLVGTPAGITFAQAQMIAAIGV